MQFEQGMATILLLLLSSLAPLLAAADVFCDNVKVLAATLPNKTSSSPLHFATATVGEAPNIVYAVALCRGDVLNDTTCAECITNVFGKVQNAMPPEVECFRAASYFADCILIYNSKDILAPSFTNSTEEENAGYPPFERWNVRNVTGNVPLITGLIHELLVETMEKAASASPRLLAMP